MKIKREMGIVLKEIFDSRFYRYLFLFTLMIAGSLVSSLRAGDNGEIRPVSVWTDGDYYKTPEALETFAPDKMLDDNLNTYACLLDTTRTGNRPNTNPPYAQEPITSHFVLDLGKKMEIQGIRFVSPNSWRTLSVRNVTIYSCDDEHGKTNRRLLKENEELLSSNSSHSVCVLWKPVQVRYIFVQVNRTYQLRNRRQGVSNNEIHYNTQIAEVRCLTQVPDDLMIRNSADMAFPLDRLHKDWIMQDHGLDIKKCFSSPNDSKTEQAMMDNVLAELDIHDAAGPYRSEKEVLLKNNVPGMDKRWKQLYFKACEKRRGLRLEFLRDETDRIIYTKHFVFGGTEGLTGISHVSDEQYYDATTERRPGSQLCMITLLEDGGLKHEVLLEKPNGVIRDPNLSWDGKTLLFAMRDSFSDDDYHLYQMTIADRKVRQLTFTPEYDGKKYPCADFEPTFTPTGDIMFSSTRHVQINDCWPNANTNLYRCNADGKNIRRLTYDELDVNYPQIMQDGRVLFTRWEYSDRNAYFCHPLMTMNPDGTAQTEYCGNNSMYPASYIQARPIPDSTKVIAIISGHHVPHKGKLALVDRTLGTQDGKCIEYVAGASPDGTPGRQKSTIKTVGYMDRKIDFFGQSGPQYQYPYPFDEENYLVAFCPEGWLTIDGPYNPPFGIYYMTANGQRELLAFDWWISSGQPIAVKERDVPVVKPSKVNPADNYGTYIVQDIYFGPGLKGIPRGTVKKLRVVALEYRAGKMGKGSNAGEVECGLVQTPISFNNGCWDVKHVLGEVNIEEDGSVAFKVPARTPVYFQLLDDNGYCVQTMRSWSTLQGGEIFACLGCHEDKLETGVMKEKHLSSMALKKVPQIPRLVTGQKHPFVARLEKENCLDSVQNYLGVNAPRISADPKDQVIGFSYVQEIQPILDRHCVVCHTGDTANPDKKKASPLNLTGAVKSVDDQKVSSDDDYKRNFTVSYLALTNNGKVKGSRWLQWLEVRSRSEMLPPYHTGSSKSELMKYLEPDHYHVNVSMVEKRTIACWIDLLIPFCGSYTQANTWTDKEREEYLYYLKKRLVLADKERLEIKESVVKQQKNGN